MNKDQSDHITAQAFSTSWNNLPSKSIYTWGQFEDWFMPLAEKDIHGRAVLEMGCGNGSLMQHLLAWCPNHLHGIDLGDSVHSAREQAMARLGGRARAVFGGGGPGTPSGGESGAEGGEGEGVVACDEACTVPEHIVGFPWHR